MCVCVCGEGGGGAFITRRFISEGDECPVGGHPRTRKNVCLKGKGGGQLKVVLVRRGFTLETEQNRTEQNRTEQNRQRTISFTPIIVRYMKKNLDMMKP